MKHYRGYRLTLGWQILIGLVLGIVLGVVFLPKQNGHYGDAKYRDDVY